MNLLENVTLRVKRVLLDDMMEHFGEYASISRYSDDGNSATIIYIDEHDMVYIEWSDGKLTSYTEGQLRKSFVPAIA